MDMDISHWTLVKEKFFEASDLPEAERYEVLNDLDYATRAEVEALLDVADTGSGVLDVPLDTGLFGLGVEALREAPVGETVADAEDALAGVLVGPYRIEKRIGRGGMGDVYRARRADGLFERAVALKVVRADSDAVLDRFYAERRILGTLEHPGIARLIGAGAEDDGPTAGRPWLALELVDGVPLTEAAEDLDPEGRIRLVIEVAEAVHHAHRRLVIHRDLKPSNVLVTTGEDGVRAAKLLDFGIAKIVDPEADPDLTGLHARRPMTRGYAAPEQIRGETITTATDIYGLGLLLFEVLAAARPFPTDQGVRVLEEAILDRDLPLPSTVTQPQAGGLEPERIRGDLDAICLKALAKEPEARYDSAEAFATDLRRHLDGVPVDARVPSMGYRTRRFVKRHRAGVAAALLVAVALMAGLGTALWQAGEARAARDEALAALGESETSLARAEAVTDFLQGLFETNNYMGPVGDTLNSIELLALGVERAQELTDEPEVQAQVLQTIGLTYFAIDEIEQADSLLRQALAIRTATLGPRHPDVAETMGRLGWRLSLAGAFREAEPLLREAVEIERASLPDNHPRIARSLSNLGGILRVMAQYDEARDILQEALTTAQKLPDGDERREIVFGVSSELGMVHRLLGEMEASETVLREALAAARTLYGNHHVQTSTALSNLTGVLLRMDQLEGAERMAQLEEAEALAREALSISRERLGDNHHHVAIDLGVLAHVLWKRGDMEQAEAMYLDSAERHRETLGADAPHLGPLLYHLSQLYQEQGAYTEAETALRGSLTVTCAAYGIDHVHTGRVQQALADLYAAWGQPAGSTECPAAPPDV